MDVDVDETVPNSSLSPEAAFDRHWANVLLSQVLTQLEEDCSTDDERRRFNALKPGISKTADAIKSPIAMELMKS